MRPMGHQRSASRMPIKGRSGGCVTFSDFDKQMRLRGLGGQDRSDTNPEAAEEPPDVDLDMADTEKPAQPANEPDEAVAVAEESGKEDPMATQMDRTIDGNAKIKVVGVGGAGGNAVNRMIRSKLRGVELVPAHPA